MDQFRAMLRAMLARCSGTLMFALLSSCGVETYRERPPRAGLAIHLLDRESPLELPYREGNLRIATQPLVPFDNIEHVRLLEAAEGGRVLVLDLDDVGRARLTEASSLHVGEQLAIVSEGRVLSAPRIRNPLTEGEAYVRVPESEVERTFDALSAKDDSH